MTALAPTTTPRPGRPWFTPGVTAALVATAAVVAYLLLGDAVTEDGYSELARAFLGGRLWVDAGLPEVVPIGGGRAYFPLPPVPTLLYMPFQAIGLSPSTTILSAIVGGVGVWLTYWLARLLGSRAAAVIAVGLAASTFGWAAGAGNDWLLAQVLGFTLAVASLHLGFRRTWPFAAGLLLGLAAGSRLPVGLTLPLLLYLYRGDRRAWAWIAAGLLLVALPIAAYNLARFGSPIDFGYAHIASLHHPGQTVLAESWFSEGIVHPSYIPRSIAVMLFGGFHVEPTFPWLRVPVSGLSIAIGAPVFLLAIRSPTPRVVRVAAATALLVMVPNWAHGSWGFWQFGYRFFIDAMPALLVPLAMAYRERPPDRWLIGAAVLSLVANLYLFLAYEIGFTTGGLPFPY
jgi:4-amino-4-deoxy-L-arabinose transferase-like glycosyltransferase